MTTPRDQFGNPLAPPSALWAWLACATAGFMIGCAGSTIEFDPAVILDPDRSTEVRVRAIESAQLSVNENDPDTVELRRSLFDIVNDPSESESVRAAAVRALAGDAFSQPKLRSRLSTLLPDAAARGDRELVQSACESAAERGWPDLTDAIVRAWAHPEPTIRPGERVEAAAITTLHPSESPAAVVFAVFASMPNALQGAKLRDGIAIWELLTALMPDHEALVALIKASPSQNGQTSAPNHPLLSAVIEALDRYGSIPASGEQLRTLAGVRSARGGELWELAERAHGGLSPEQRVGLGPRHVPVLAHLIAHSPEVLREDRGALISRIEARIRGGAHVSRIRGVPPGLTTESFDEQAGALSWGDLATVELLSGCLAHPPVGDTWIEQADRDRADRTTEFGGVIEFDERGSCVLRQYVPESWARTGDERFVAPASMLADAADAIAVYSLQAQRVQNRAHAGAGYGELARARENGRVWMVLTSVGPSSLNADVVFPSGACLDLGTIRRGIGLDTGSGRVE